MIWEEETFPWLTGLIIWKEATCQTSVSNFALEWIYSAEYIRFLKDELKPLCMLCNGWRQTFVAAYDY